MILRPATLYDIAEFVPRNEVMAGWYRIWDRPLVGLAPFVELARPWALRHGGRPRVILGTLPQGPRDNLPWVWAAFARQAAADGGTLRAGLMIRGWLDTHARGRYTIPEVSSPDFVRPLRALGFEQVKGDLWRWRS